MFVRVTVAITHMMRQRRGSVKEGWRDEMVGQGLYVVKIHLSIGNLLNLGGWDVVNDPTRQIEREMAPLLGFIVTSKK